MIRKRALACMTLAVSLAALAGCNWLGAAQARQEGKDVSAEYTGFADKSAVIAVYADQATTNEFSAARDEIAGFVAVELRKAVPSVKLVDPRAVIRWQDETINWQALSERDIGKHFGVDRVLYIELLDYSTKVPGAMGYVQGRIRATVKVFEMAPGSGSAMLPAWQSTMDVYWPPDGPMDLMKMSEVTVRKNVLQRFAEKIGKAFKDYKDYGETIRDKAGAGQ